MENSLVLTLQSETQRPSASTDSLIKEWLFRFGVEHNVDVAPRLPLWLEAFAGMDADTLESLFKRAMRTCKFFPKISEILEPVRHAEQTAIPQAAIEAWNHVLALRREHYNPDFPQYLSAHVRALPERVQAACRASGVFGEFETTEQLHTWAKKAFLESFARWGETEQNKYLLPDGDIKDMLADFAESKAMPRALLESGESKVFPYTPEIAARRIAAEKENTETVAKLPAPQREAPRVIDFEGRSAELKRQAELIQQKYPVGEKK